MFEELIYGTTDIIVNYIHIVKKGGDEGDIIELANKF